MIVTSCSIISFACLVVCGTACASARNEAPAPRPLLTPQTSGTSALLQAVSVVDERTVWGSGHEGTWVRTTDGGVSWTAGRVPDADTLQFRDVHALSADVAWLLAAGPGSMSRIYHTTDGGRSWTLQHQNAEPKAFYDCFAFWDAKDGVVFSDQVDGRTVVLETSDGVNWMNVPAARLPKPDGSEVAFAASGTCVATWGDRFGWIATGGGSAARVFRTDDRGGHWTAAVTPIAVGPTAGLTTVAFRDSAHGVAMGGDVAKLDKRSDNVIRTDDGGRTWVLGTRPPFVGPVHAAAYASGIKTRALVAVGPGGLVLSPDDGRSWQLLDTLSHWSVEFGPGAVGWAVGPDGRITRIDLFARSRPAHYNDPRLRTTTRASDLR